MDLIKLPDSHFLIPINMFDICLIDGAKKNFILEFYTASQIGKKNTCYYLDKFSYHIKNEYNIELKEYCKIYLKIEWPKCPVKKQDVGYKITGKGLILSQFNKGGVNKEHCTNFAKSCEKLSRDRMGENNPMHGKKSWNTGLTKETNEIVRLVAEKRIGRKNSDETKEKQREARKNHPLKIRHNTPHSEETKEFLRRNTASLWSRGVFNKTTSIHIKMREFLQTLQFVENFVEEFHIKYFSIDFAFPEHKIAIECQGSYYHVDPRIYPNGAKNAMQRRNLARDKMKREFLNKIDWIIIEIWEPEINDGSFKEEILCKFKELNLLKK